MTQSSCEQVPTAQFAQGRQTCMFLALMRTCLNYSGGVLVAPLNGRFLSGSCPFQRTGSLLESNSCGRQQHRQVGPATSWVHVPATVCLNFTVLVSHCRTAWQPSLAANCRRLFARRGISCTAVGAPSGRLFDSSLAWLRVSQGFFSA